jgi:phenylacetate-CoA ligase
MRRMDKITGRSDDMLIIRGVNVFPSQIEEQLLSVDSLSPHYFIEVSKQGHLDAIEVNVELAGGANTGGKEEAAKALKHRIKSYIGISAGVKVHDQGGIPRSEGKAQRVVDKR